MEENLLLLKHFNLKKIGSLIKAWQVQRSAIRRPMKNLLTVQIEDFQFLNVFHRPPNLNRR